MKVAHVPLPHYVVTDLLYHVCNLDVVQPVICNSIRDDTSHFFHIVSFVEVYRPSSFFPKIFGNGWLSNAQSFGDLGLSQISLEQPPRYHSPYSRYYRFRSNLVRGLQSYNSRKFVVLYTKTSSLYLSIIKLGIHDHLKCNSEIWNFRPYSP